MIFFAFNLLTSGVPLSMVCAVIGLVAAFFLVAAVVRSPAGNQRMQEISGAIQEGAKAYLNRQVITISSIAVIIFILLFIFKDRPTAIGFMIGAFCSLSAGYIGMRIAVVANVRTTEAATESITKALRMAFNGGAVTGLLVVGLALLAVSIFYTVVGRMLGPQMAVSSLVGLALGASLISVFARLGGGIYTKAADVGADLVGKIEQGLEEDDPRNPATIADNVGDNVGDCAGMAADVFETYAVSLIGAILVGALTLGGNSAALVYPFVLGGISVLGAICGVLFVNVANGKPAAVLMGGVLTSAIISGILFWPATHYLFPDGLTIAGATRTPTQLYCASVIGLVMTAVVVAITNYYTSMRYSPVQKIARASETGHATNIIAGLAVGQHATAMPVGFIGIAIKAVTKGYAIASAGLAALVLFGSYVEELRAHNVAYAEFHFSLTEPKVIIGLFLGGLLPFIFTAFSMAAVGKAAGAAVREVRRQLQAKPGILTGQDLPDYATCVDIVTKAALREMIVPALLPLFFVVAVAMIPQLGPVVLGGMLV